MADKPVERDRPSRRPGVASAGRARGLRGQRVVADDLANEPSEAHARAAGLHEVPEGRVAPEQLPSRDKSVSPARSDKIHPTSEPDGEPHTHENRQG